ncbi:MAG: hypothetical protein JWL72_509 [Ilumatobacteraceae bacterium]|nr:hypothetical protein [Ilumatobacteraceae bacterium]
MTTDLEPQLRRAFARSADLAPATDPAWSSPLAVTVRAGESPASRRPPGRRVLVGALCAAALIGAIAVVTLTRAPDPVTSTPLAPVFQPPGTEFPISSTSALPPTGGAFDPASVRSIAVPNHPSLTVYTEAMAMNGHVRRYFCLEERAGGSGCAPEWNDANPDIGETSTVDNRIGTFNLWTWQNVPAAAAFVVWTDGATTLWQRPVAGVGAFPIADGQLNFAGAVAYDASGHELVRAGFGIQPPPAEDPDGGLVSNLSDLQNGSLQDLARSTIETCLGDVHANTWDDCVGVADTVVHTEFVNLGGDLVPYPDHPGCDPGYTQSSDAGRTGCYRTPLAPPDTTDTADAPDTSATTATTATTEVVVTATT